MVHGGHDKRKHWVTRGIATMGRGKEIVTMKQKLAGALLLSMLWGSCAIAEGVNAEAVPDAGAASANLATMHWGESRLTWGDQYICSGPPWWSGAFKIGGQWLTNGWYVTGDGSNASCSLNVDLDRSFLTNDLFVVVALVAAPGGTLSVELYDTNDLAFVTNSLGVLTAAGGSLVVTAAVPTGVTSDAVGLRLRPGPGEMLVQQTVLFVDDGSATCAESRPYDSRPERNRFTKRRGVRQRTGCHCP